MKIVTKPNRILLSTLMLLFSVAVTIGCDTQPRSNGADLAGIVSKVIQRCDLEQRSIEAASVTAFLLVPQITGETVEFPMMASDDFESASLEIEIPLGTQVTVEIRAVVSDELTTLASATRPVESDTLNFGAIDFMLADENNNGISDCTELVVEPDGSLSWPPACLGEPGTDQNSSTPNWDDNCTVKRSSIGGVFADSLYAVGIQRVVYCAGFGEGATYISFADGEYGPVSEAAMKEFQLSGPDPLTDDGIVGGMSWAKLQSRIELLTTGEFQENAEGIVSALNTYGFSQGRCANIALFYQTIYPAENGQGTIEGEWTLARNQPDEGEQIPFSIASNDLVNESE
jgi:peptidoglycan hydrolase-like protein with peptidoglycan-binding domain